MIPNKDNQTIKIFIEPTKNRVILCVNACTPTYWKKEQKPLEELKHRDDIVITNSGKGGTVVRIDLKGYIKDSEKQVNTTSTAEI